MIKAKEILDLIEDAEVVGKAAEPELPSLQDQQLEVLSLVKDSLQRVKYSKQALDLFHVTNQVGCMLTPQAERIHREIEQLVKDMFWSQQ